MGSKTREIQLPGLRVKLGEPRQVREGVGYLWFPFINQFPTGEIMLNAILTADTNENLADAYCVHISHDSGQTWDAPYDVAGFGGGVIAKIPTPDGALVGPQFYTWYNPPGQQRRISSHYERFEDGGNRYTVEPFGLHVEGLPRDIQPSRFEGKWGRFWPTRTVLYGHAIFVDGAWLTIASLHYAGDERRILGLLRSTDLGRTWHYVSDITDQETCRDAREGPGEPDLIQLADGDLMCVMRVGAGRSQYLARSYSSDGGKFWSPVDRLPAWSVAPCLRRLQNEVIALSTGRPGIYLWLSTDPRAQTWQAVDLVEHHNAWAPNATHRIVPVESEDRRERHDKDQTTAYTDFIELSPGKILLAYDRIAYGWSPVAKDAEERNRIYVIDIEIERA